MHRYWWIKHLITRINSSGLHWRGALPPCNAGPLLPRPLFSLSLASLPPFYFGVYLLLAPFLAKPDPMEHTCCTSYPPSTRLVVVLLLFFIVLHCASQIIADSGVISFLQPYPNPAPASMPRALTPFQSSAFSGASRFF